MDYLLTKTNRSTRNSKAYILHFAQKCCNLTYLLPHLVNSLWSNRTLPRAIMIALPTITVLYVLVNISYYTVLSPQDVLDAEAIATVRYHLFPLLILKHYWSIYVILRAIAFITYITTFYFSIVLRNAQWN